MRNDSHYVRPVLCSAVIHPELVLLIGHHELRNAAGIRPFVLAQITPRCLEQIEIVIARIYWVDTPQNNVYKYTRRIAEQLSGFSKKMVGRKWQRLAPILNFGIQTKRDVSLFHTLRKTYQLAL